MRSMSSGIGSVTTMKSVHTAKARRKCRSRAAHAPCASTTLPADTAPPGVTTRGRRPFSTRTMGVRSKMRTPRSSSTRRSSRASLPGWSTVRSGVITPPTKRGESATRPRLGGVHAPQPVGVAVLARAAGTSPSSGPGCQSPARAYRMPSCQCVDARVVTRDPAVELVDHGGEGGRVGHPALLAERRAQARELRPRRREEAAVGAAAAGADDVGLDEHDAEARVALAQLVGGPEAGEAAADDADVGGRLAGQRRARRAGVGAQRLLQPPAARARPPAPPAAASPSACRLIESSLIVRPP